MKSVNCVLDCAHWSLKLIKFVQIAARSLDLFFTKRVQRGRMSFMFRYSAYQWCFCCSSRKFQRIAELKALESLCHSLSCVGDSGVMQVLLKECVSLAAASEEWVASCDFGSKCELVRAVTFWYLFIVHFVETQPSFASAEACNTFWSVFLKWVWRVQQTSEYSCNVDLGGGEGVLLFVGCCISFASCLRYFLHAVLLFCFCRSPQMWK